MSETPTETPTLSAIRAVDKPQAELQGELQLQLDEFCRISHAESRTSTSVKRLKEGLDAFVVSDVLDPSECLFLLNSATQLGFSFWHPTEHRTDYRNAETVEVTHTGLADVIFKRISSYAPEFMEFEWGDPRWQPDMDGRWVISHVNPALLFVRYGPGGHFSPHTDGYTIEDFNTRSLFSVLVYLNTCEEGGRTRMLSGGDGSEQEQFVVRDGVHRWTEDRTIASAEAVAGSTLCFFQDLPHEGEPVGHGCAKALIRTDIMYRREPPRCTAPKDVEAYEMFRKAELLEGDGDAIQAAALFRRAFKLSPALADVYGV